MAASAGKVEVEVEATMTGQALKIYALEKAVEIEAAHARSGNGYDGTRVVTVAGEFEKYLTGEDPWHVEVGGQWFTAAQWEAVQAYAKGTDAETEEV